MESEQHFNFIMICGSFKGIVSQLKVYGETAMQELTNLVLKVGYLSQNIWLCGINDTAE